MQNLKKCLRQLCEIALLEVILAMLIQKGLNIF